MFGSDALNGDGFSWSAALALAQFCKLAYQSDRTVLRTSEQWGFQQSKVVSIANSKCILAANTANVVVAFRGAQSLGDWLLEQDSTTILFNGVGVQKACHDDYQVLRPGIAEFLSSATPTPRIWLTGHGVGGAHATLAAVALIDQGIAGVHTFGQPRPGDQSLQQFVGQRLAGKYFRFVNDEDILTRLPPGLMNVGTCFAFDTAGNLKGELETASDLELPALSDEQFSNLKVEIRHHKSVLEQEASEATETNDPRQGSLYSALESVVPSLTDHRLERYAAAIRRQSSDVSIDSTVAIEATHRFAPASAIGATVFTSASGNFGGLEGVPQTGLEGIPVAAAKRAPDQIPVLLRLKTARWQAPEGLTVNSHFGTFVSAVASESELELLKKDSDIASINFSRDAGVEELDHSVEFVGGRDIQRPPLSELGDSALVGLIDSGIDVLHEAFRDPNGACRILAVWNQRDNSGASPKGVDPNFTQNYGTLYLTADLDKFIAGANPTPQALRDPSLHGTHVASIAAGRSIGTLADGLAPAARLVVVIPNMTTRPGDPPSLGYSSSHVDALDFLKRVSQGGNAVSQNQLPMAVNVSLGMNAGAHDGTSFLEAAFDGVTGGGRDEGFVIVKSAGNERGQYGHTRVQAFAGLVQVQWDSSGTQPRDYLETWYSAWDTLQFALTDPAGNRSAVVSEANPNVNVALGGNYCQLTLDRNHRDNGDKQLVIVITPQTNAVQTGRWTLDVIGTEVLSERGQVDVWVERDDSRAVRFVTDVPQMTLSIPGTAATVITVAACNQATPLGLTGSSSYGLTRDGRYKPDVCAPGEQIRAAHANQVDHQAVVAMTGTSMAAPHVTGALALALSCRHKQVGKPQFNAQQLIKALIRTAKSNGRHHEGFGYGRLHAAELFTDLTT